MSRLRYLAGVAFLASLGLAGVGWAPVAAPRWDLFGDARVRYEANTAIDDAPERHRGVLRLRAGATFDANDLFRVGARVVTGDPGDPRTADVTIGEFGDDLELSFDRAFVEMRLDHGLATAGKFANPFATTELVWDADVNPAGAAGWVEPGRIGGFTPRLTGIFALLDERSRDSDGTMWGAQAGLRREWAGGVALEVAAAYWDYTIPTLAGADDPGDTRGNYLTLDGSAYLSDFDLADLTATLTLPGPSEAYPVRVVADIVKNLGAAVDEDTGFQVEVRIGREWERRRFELRAGYGQCETDAVLGAFSNDNLPLATNYRNHTLRAAYGVRDDTALSLTWYLYGRLHADPRHPDADPDELASRVRLDLMVRF